jgi:hypothetical protein
MKVQRTLCAVAVPARLSFTAPPHADDLFKRLNTGSQEYRADVFASQGKKQITLILASRHPHASAASIFHSLLKASAAPSNCF